MDPLRDDPVMAELIEAHGPLRVEPAEDLFRRFAVSIINQQLSTASAAAIRDRVFDRVEVTPAGLLAADAEALRAAGLSRSKAEYLRNAAAAFEERGYSVESFAGMPDDAVVEELTSITGVGVWTAKMALIFGLGREDVFPVEDLGIRRGMTAAYGIEEADAMTERATSWRPYRSYAARYLWRVVD